MDSHENLGKAARRAAWQQVRPQIRDAYQAAKARGVHEPIMLVVDVREGRLQKLVSSILGFDQIRDRLEDARQKKLLPIALFDVPTTDIQRCLGTHAKRAATCLSRQPVVGKFHIAVLNRDGISWGFLSVIP